MGILRAERVSGLGGANAIKGSVEMRGAQNLRAEIVNGNADFNLGSSDFTIECWYNPSGTSGTGNSLDVDLLMLWNNSTNKRSYGLYRDSSGYLGLIGSSDGTNSDMQSYHSYNFSDVNAWYHIAAVRISNTATVYVNGTSIGSATVSGSFYENTVDNLVVGGQLAGTSYDSKIARGFISNMRLIIGDGIYTGNFTPPANELTVTPNTRLLCCQSPGNILQEATGKTLIAHRSSVNNSFAKASTFAPDKGEDHGTTFADNTKFDTLSYLVPPGGTTAERGRGRGVVLGGGRSGSPTKINTISYIEIQSTGFSNDFGDLTESVIIAGCCASSTRGVRGGGYNTPTNSNVIDYVTIATTSNATNFGDLTIARHWVMGGGSQTRGIFGGGNMGASPNPNSNTIDYITIASEGDASDFGDLINSYTPTIGSGNAAASPTRLLFAGGSQDTPAPQTVQNAIQYVTIASTGDATDFGDLTDNKVRFGVCSSSTRALYGGAGGSDTAKTNSITYVTIATTGNTEDFGDRTVGVNNVAATSNSIRGVFIGGLGSHTSENHIDYVTIATTGNAVDWGDSFYLLEHTSACSDSHGGIS